MWHLINCVLGDLKTPSLEMLTIRYKILLTWQLQHRGQSWTSAQSQHISLIYQNFWLPGFNTDNRMQLRHVHFAKNIFFSGCIPQLFYCFYYSSFSNNDSFSLTCRLVPALQLKMPRGRATSGSSPAPVTLSGSRSSRCLAHPCLLQSVLSQVSCFHQGQEHQDKIGATSAGNPPQVQVPLLGLFWF